MTDPRTLIINADDLGATPGVNAGIFEAHAQGVVTSTSLMVARPAAEAAADALGDHPKLGVGLHVELTGGRPVLPPERLPSLVDAEGRLAAERSALTMADREQVRAEVEAQFARFKALVGRLPTHIDGHHHCHRVPQVLDAVVAIAAADDIPVRRASADIAARLGAEGIRTSDRFDNDFYAEGATAQGLLDRFETLPPGTTELMVHPGHVDSALRAASGYTDDRARELAILTSDATRRALAEADILLVSFAEAPLAVPKST